MHRKPATDVCTRESLAMLGDEIPTTQHVLLTRYTVKSDWTNTRVHKAREAKETTSSFPRNDYWAHHPGTMGPGISKKATLSPIGKGRIIHV